ncbi:MAG: hypothetical protein BBJ57_02065 [Desulfobacterales bacterium PC51MH44]|nr:MAG: hypothetical protein BBJ57_02065 [Desulfobacterales bacterium PC51MH44]
MRKKGNTKVVSNLGVTASGDFAGKSVAAVEGMKPADLPGKNLVTAQESEKAPTHVQAGLSESEVQVKAEEVFASKKAEADKLEASEKAKSDVIESLNKIEASSDEAKAMVDLEIANVTAGETVHAGVVAQECRLIDIRAKNTMPQINVKSSASGVSKQDAVEAAFALTYMPTVAAKMEGAALEAGQKLGFMSVKALASHALVAAGKQGLSFASTEQDISAALSTASVATIISNVANKYIAERFESSDAVNIIRKVTKPKTVQDFKVNTGVRLAAGGAFQKIAEGQEIPLASISDASYTHKANMYGQRIGITRQMLINDDLGLLMDLVNQMIMNGEDALVDTFVTAIEAAETAGFFAAGNSNLNTAGLIPSSAGYKAMNLLFAGMTDDKNRKTQIMPTMILNPASLVSDSQEMFVSTEIRDTTASKTRGTKNIYTGKYEPLQLNYLADAASAWYAFADPNRIPAFVASYLFGRQTPTILPAQTQYADLSEMMVGYFDFGIDTAMSQGAVKLRA